MKRAIPRHPGFTLVVAIALAGTSPPAWANPGQCGQPVSTGTRPVATDCLHILRAAVQLETCSPQCQCAPSGSMPISATDALVCLRMAVGSTTVSADCPCPVFTTEATDAFGGLEAPSRLAASGDGRVFVSDTGGGIVAIYDDAGRRVGTLAGIGRPLGIALFHAANDLTYAWVGDEQDGSVHIFENDSEIGQLGAGAGEFTKPNGIAIAGDRVYVADSGAHHIAVYTVDGTKIGEFGTRGTGNGELDFPTDIAIAEGSGEVYVADFNNHRIAVFNLEGTWTRNILPPPNDQGDPVFYRPTGLDVDANGNIYVVDNTLSCVAIMENTGMLLDVIGYEDGQYWTGDLRVPIDAAAVGGRLYVTSSKDRRVLVFTDGATPTMMLTVPAIAPLQAYALASLNTGATFDDPHASVANCDTCHVPHNVAASYPTRLSTLCESCHFSGGPAMAVQTHSSLTTDNGYGDWDVKCWSCHNPHNQEQDHAFGTTYGKYVRKSLEADIDIIDPNAPGPYYPPISVARTARSDVVEFTSNTGFVDGDGVTDDDICQVCHENTANYNKISAPNSHSNYGTDTQPGGTCTNCHPHADGFYPSGGGSCVGCHSITQPGSGNYRRQVTSTGGDFERASHHVTDGTTTEIVGDGDCQVCHDQSQHWSNPDPTVFLKDADGGAPYAYSGQGASIEGFCLACHDADSSLLFDSDGNPADGNQPFSDGRTPLDIQTDWLTSSHGTTGVVALSADACLACHGGSDSTRPGLTADQNVHGSDLAHILSPTVAGVAVANVEEELCLACHDGSVAAADIATDLAKTYTHPVSTTLGVHDPTEDPGTMTRHAECQDCHDPHAANSAAATAPSAGGRLAGASGVDVTGIGIDPVAYQYELCFKCHADNPNVPAPTIPRQFAEANLRLRFDAGNASYHPVEAAGQNNNVPSLINGLTESSVVYCTDCHASDTGPGAGGPGAAGPHGSAWQFLLERRYEIADNTSESAQVYDMCYKCHSRTSILNNDSFKEHNKHIRGEKAPCSVCHDPHGVATNSHLINFRTQDENGNPLVQPSSSGRLEFIDQGNRKGQCYLRCHNKNHDPKSY